MNMYETKAIKALLVSHCSKMLSSGCSKNRELLLTWEVDISLCLFVGLLNHPVGTQGRFLACMASPTLWDVPQRDRRRKTAVKKTLVCCNTTHQGGKIHHSDVLCCHGTSCSTVLVQSPQYRISAKSELYVSKNVDKNMATVFGLFNTPWYFALFSPL